MLSSCNNRLQLLLDDTKTSTPLHSKALKITSTSCWSLCRHLIASGRDAARRCNRKATTAPSSFRLCQRQTTLCSCSSGGRHEGQTNVCSTQKGETEKTETALLRHLRRPATSPKTSVSYDNTQQQRQQQRQRQQRCVGNNRIKENNVINHSNSNNDNNNNNNNNNARAFLSTAGAAAPFPVGADPMPAMSDGRSNKRFYQPRQVRKALGFDLQTSCRRWCCDERVTAVSRRRQKPGTSVLGCGPQARMWRRSRC